MESLAPPLHILLHVLHGMSAGRSLRGLLREVLMTSPRTDFHLKMRKWWLSYEAGAPVADDFWRDQSLYRQALVKLLEQGLAGASVGDALKDLEREIRRAMEEEIEEFVAALPIKTLLPLVFFVFPALMLLVFGPLLMGLMETLK